MINRKFYSHIKRRGQTMMEYITLVALIAVASIPIAKILGDVFRDRVLNAADAMIDNKGQIQDQSTEIVRGGQDKVRRSMSNYYKR